jgi:antitoxin MazE
MNTPTFDISSTQDILRLACGGVAVPTKIQRWGNSQGVRVPKGVLAEASLEVGDVVDVRAVDGAIVVTKLRNRRGRVALEDLVATLPAAASREEVDWGVPEGDEV